MNKREIWIDYLRAFLIILVVAHHSAMAYTTFAFYNKETYILSTNPIVDIQRWIGMDIFVFFNDIFFMSLMFLISGIFVFQSIQKKGPVSFLKDRLFRLFLPFVIGVSVLMLFAYYPAYHIGHSTNSIKDYVVDYFTAEGWPVGPPWFIWVLFLFNIVIALILPFIKNQMVALSEKLSILKNKPLTLFTMWVIVTWIIYVPMRITFGADTWTGIGPFDFQKSRLLLYFGYFMIGVIIGSISNEQSLFSFDSKLIKNWKIWIILSLIAYLSLLLVKDPLEQLLSNRQLNDIQIQLIYSTFYVISCALSCFAFISTFKAIGNKPNLFFESLVPNAFGIYLIHYILIVWCQFALLQFDIPAVLKFAITFLIVLLTSWIISHYLRKSRFIVRII